MRISLPWGAMRVTDFQGAYVDHSCALCLRTSLRGKPRSLPLLAYDTPEQAQRAADYLTAAFARDAPRLTLDRQRELAIPW